MGGSAAITACGAARLGLDTALVAAVGRDLLGTFMLDALADSGVDVSGCVADPAIPTPASPSHWYAATTARS